MGHVSKLLISWAGGIQHTMSSRLVHNQRDSTAISGQINKQQGDFGSRSGLCKAGNKTKPLGSGENVLSPHKHLQDYLESSATQQVR